MSTITKERLLKIQQWSETYGPVSNVMLPAEEAEELARIALASLEAEPIYQLVNDDWYDTDKDTYDAVVSSGARGRIVYTAPPAPVVPDCVERKDFEAWARSAGFNEDWYFFTNTHPNHYDDDHVNDMWASWNACRAAMLQGADGALTNEDTKRVGELVMWVKRLAHSLRKANPDSKLQSDAMDYLSRKGLIGVEDILR
ncbi:hypothetical protein ACNKJC_000700 [Enterobacter hormaechei]